MTMLRSQKSFPKFAALIFVLWITLNEIFAFQNPRNSFSTKTRNFPLSASSYGKHDLPRRSLYSTSTALSMIVLGDEATTTLSTNFFQNKDTWIFLAGVFPFAWATVEFWRRIMFGEPFGTGTDSVIIGMDDAPQDSRGRRVLGQGALITAYVLFVFAFGTIGIVLYSVLSSAPPPTTFAS
jgi:hypothetical protein